MRNRRRRLRRAGLQVRATRRAPSLANAAPASGGPPRAANRPSRPDGRCFHEQHTKNNLKFDWPGLAQLEGETSERPHSKGGGTARRVYIMRRTQPTIMYSDSA
jgi:hypothetical protein